ncbi:MAG: hypothetical protein JWO47_550 [Candidatus Saccharibacteria bacterium]|nr:hypothetical protein [Candidatus Saccharibacteria bacterium]
MKLASLQHRDKKEPVWHVQVAVLVAIVLQLLLSSKLVVGPRYLIVGLEVLLLLALAVFGPFRKQLSSHLRRTLAVVLIAIISLSNITSLILVIDSLFTKSDVTGRQLIVSGLAIYLTNIIIFGLWYWELDSNGVQGQSAAVKPVDFLFPQMSMDKSADWNPTFFDYLYVSVTNATAFSPTDTLPLTHRSKLLMTLQSITSLLTIALVAARAVNILG